MTRSLVQDIITCLNMLPSKNGIGSNLRPAAIILVYSNSYYNKTKITFGAYVQVYIDNTNSTKKITLGAIEIIPANERGGY